MMSWLREKHRRVQSFMNDLKLNPRSSSLRKLAHNKNCGFSLGIKIAATHLQLSINSGSGQSSEKIGSIDIQYVGLGSSFRGCGAVHSVDSGSSDSDAGWEPVRGVRQLPD
ncbi:unnamed protein product [Fraxinus pennsylvanica]|uniref:Uncharacterized protein n=1 Tax=Fraxinus pennsylvanica TaxID=56036 RepID=A0AAD1ZX31_9LAMI|nr:unnamed protein product [Fraxinus pennsylvanica]